MRRFKDSNALNTNKKPVFFSSKKKEIEYNQKTFPSLNLTQHNPNKYGDGDSIYMDKIKFETDDVDKEELEQELSGWCSMTLDRSSNRSVRSMRTRTIQDTLEYNTLERGLNRGLTKIVSKYVDFVDDYIETWGEYEYIQMFLFPNYDYDYFDKLDDLWEEEEVDDDVTS
tara:strand:- start:554 stop:1063 length:510 start_codon:yes stop_codon:yes gene_type:complete